MIQRKFKIGYNRAARIIDVMGWEASLALQTVHGLGRFWWDRLAELRSSVPNKGIIWSVCATDRHAGPLLRPECDGRRAPRRRCVSSSGHGGHGLIRTPSVG